MASLIDNTGLADLLPASIAADEQIDATVKALQAMTDDIIGRRGYPALYLRFNELTSGQLDHLAVMFDITTWRDSWPVELKRSVLNMIFGQKSRVGTLSAVREALSSLGAAVSVTEWWQTYPKGTPHTFAVEATLSEFFGVLTSELQEDLMGVLDESKPARSLYTFTLKTAERGGVAFVGVARSLSFRRLKNF